MIDAELVAISKDLKTKLAGMKDARPSERLAAIETAQAESKAALGKAGVGISDADKIAFFDKMQAYCIEVLEGRLGGEHVKDAEHWPYEMAMQGTLGPKIFEAINNETIYEDFE